MSKIFSSPGVSSRPLTPTERFRERIREILEILEISETRRTGSKRFFRRLWRQNSRENRRLKAEIRKLSLALSIPTKAVEGPPLQVENLETTLSAVTFDPAQIRIA